MPNKKRIEPADLMPMADYGKERKERRTKISALKKDRRLQVGPDVTFYFECYDTMWHQVHEMLYIERGGEAQVADELEAYNPLIPQGRELVATFMIEIEDENRRRTTLAKLGGIEDSISIDFDGEKVVAVPETGEERTREDGKTSSVHFLHFPFTAAQVAKFSKPGQRVVIGLDHKEYAHLAVMPEAVRTALAKDFD
jgi:hypothetical protein